MKTNRAHFLQLLEQVQPGLSSKEVLEQSSCFVFTGGRVHTFNDEISCSIPCEVGITGAVTAAPLLAILAKLSEDEVDVEPEAAQVIIKGKSRRTGVLMEAEVRLPIDKVEVPSKWRPLPPDFCEALEVTVHCAGSNADESFALTCVHIHPDFLEACDNYQMARYPVKSTVRGSILVRASTIKPVVGLGASEIAETRSWLHFKTHSGLVVSVRKHVEDYPDLAAALDVSDGVPAVLPGGLAEAVDKAEVFSKVTSGTNQVKVSLSAGALLLTGEGDLGWYQEKKKIAYDGPGIIFMISPKLLVEITKKHNDCTISPSRLKVDGGKFVFVTSLGNPPTKGK